MPGWLSFIFNVILGLVGLQRKSQVSAQERAGRAEVALEAERQADVETSKVIDARRAAAAEQLRNAPSTVTLDPSAPINQDDGFKRRN